MRNLALGLGFGLVSGKVGEYSAKPHSTLPIPSDAYKIQTALGKVDNLARSPIPHSPHFPFRIKKGFPIAREAFFVTTTGVEPAHP